MKRIFGWLQDGKYPNASTMAAEFEVAAKTVRRDIEFMRERWELPIEYDGRRFGFFFSKPVERFPGVPVSEKELFALCVAHKAIEQYHGTAFQQPLCDSDPRLLFRNDGSVPFSLNRSTVTSPFQPARKNCARSASQNRTR